MRLIILFEILIFFLFVFEVNFNFSGIWKNKQQTFGNCLRNNKKERFRLDWDGI